jgi:hypothetical protein
MLELTNPRWQELGHAFGTAEDIPRLLEALATHEGAREREELWFGMWATLCPDGRVQSAAYAAVPHVLAIAQGRAFGERVAALHFVASVEVARQAGGAPAIPHDLVAAYAVAVESMPAFVAEMTSAPWDEPTARIMSAALLAGKRQAKLARSLLDLSEE